MKRRQNKQGLALIREAMCSLGIKIMRATCVLIAEFTSRSGRRWEVIRQDSVTGGLDQILILTRCKKCKKVIWESVSADSRCDDMFIGCHKCSPLIKVPIHLAKIARDKAYDLKSKAIAHAVKHGGSGAWYPI